MVYEKNTLVWEEAVWILMQIAKWRKQKNTERRCLRKTKEACRADAGDGGREGAAAESWWA